MAATWTNRTGFASDSGLIGLKLASGEGACVPCAALQASWYQLAMNWCWGLAGGPATGNITGATQHAGVLWCNGAYQWGSASLNGIGYRIFGNLVGHTVTGTTPTGDNAYFDGTIQIFTVEAGAATGRFASAYAGVISRIDSSWKSPNLAGFGISRLGSNTYNAKVERLSNVDIHIPVKNGVREMVINDDFNFGLRDNLNQWTNINSMTTRAANPDNSTTLAVPTSIDSIFASLSHVMFYNELSGGLDVEFYGPALDRYKEAA